MESFFENTRDIFHILYQIAVFDKTLYSSRDIRLLEYITADQFTVYLSCDTYHRNAVRKCGCNTGDQICGTGT